MSFKGKVIAVHNNLPLRMHATPWPGSRVLPRKLEVGDIVDIENVEDGWFSVYDPKSGQTGWVDRDFIQELTALQPDVPPCSIEPEGKDWIALAWQWVWVLFCLVIIGWLFFAALSFVGII